MLINRRNKWQSTEASSTLGVHIIFIDHIKKQTNYPMIHFFVILMIAQALMTGSCLNACYAPFSDNDYVDLSITKIVEYIGSGIRFDIKHEVREVNYHQVSFPVVWCDPIDLETTGNMHWFMTSALENPTPHFGEGVALTNHSLTHIHCVNGQVGSGNWFYIYFGFDANNPKFSNAKYKVFQGELLYIICKDTSRFPNNSYCYAGNAHYIDHALMNIEVNKHLPESTKDCSWESQQYHNILKKLFLKKEGSYATYDRLISDVSFWKRKRF